MEGTLASILYFASNFAPQGWALCQGQIIAISQNTALFALLGTTYGGNGQTTYALPDLRGRVPVGVGQGPGLSPIDLGEVAGSNTVTLTTSEIPAHTHGVTVNIAVSTLNATSDEPDGQILASTGADLFAAPAQANGTLGGTTLSTTATGGGQPVSIIQPVLGLTALICTQGFFPARN